MMSCRSIFGLISVALALTAGCSSDPTRGYSATSTFPQAISTVAVPIFTTRSYVRNVEFELTDALIKEIEARTPYKVTSEQRADTIILGQIHSVELGQLSKSPRTGLSEEVIVSVTIDFQWRDLRSGKVLLERKSFAGHGLFVPSRPGGEPFDLGTFATVQQLARDIVAEMRLDW